MFWGRGKPGASKHPWACQSHGTAGNRDRFGLHLRCYLAVQLLLPYGTAQFLQPARGCVLSFCLKPSADRGRVRPEMAIDSSSVPERMHQSIEEAGREVRKVDHYLVNRSTDKKEREETNQTLKTEPASCTPQSKAEQSKYPTDTTSAGICVTKNSPNHSKQQ